MSQETLYQATENVLSQLRFVLSVTDDRTYSRSLNTLNGSSIGEHMRHTIEFFQCMISGTSKGTINYDRRRRNQDLETRRRAAEKVIDYISAYMKSHPPDQAIEMETSYDPEGDRPATIATSLMRELAYNLEHAIHHLAIIRIGLAETNPGLELPADFGVAVSTVRHRKSAANSQ